MTPDSLVGSGHVIGGANRADPLETAARGSSGRTGCSARRSVCDTPRTGTWDVRVTVNDLALETGAGDADADAVAHGLCHCGPMEQEQVFAATARMRRGLAELLADLDQRQLATPSLCVGWDVLTCAAHTAPTANGSTARFMLAVLRYGGPHRANTALAKRLAARGRDAVVELLQENADRRVCPPGVREYGPFADQVVHGLDIRRPLGVRWEPENEDVRAVLGFLTSGRAVGFVRRGVLTGLRVDAEDVEFAMGNGPVVRGRGVDLAAALCGRASVVEDLTGEGIRTLRDRLA